MLSNLSLRRGVGLDTGVRGAASSHLTSVLREVLSAAIKWEALIPLWRFCEAAVAYA